MKDLNNVSLIGRLTRDAEVKYTSANYPVTSFGLAVNRSVKKGDKWQDEASFFDVTVFGKTGERLQQYLKKGKQIAVIGELKQERWQQDGQNRSKVIIVANDLYLLGNKSDAQKETFEDNEDQIPF